MNINKTAYTSFVAFSAAIATLVVTGMLAGPSNATENRSGDDTISKDELADHDSRDSCWKAIDGKVYDVTDYIPDHPSPEDVMLEWCGKDATEGWHDKGGGRPHSPVAGRMLEEYLIGTLEGAEPTEDEKTAEDEQPSAETEAKASDRPSGKVQLGLAPGTWLDGRYRGTFSDRGYFQVHIQFELEDDHLHNLSFRHLYYADNDYLRMDEDDDLYAVMQQHEQILEYLEGRHVTEIVGLYTPENVVDDIDGFTGATLRGSKIISAIRDGLNRGVYTWP